MVALADVRELTRAEKVTLIRRTLREHPDWTHRQVAASLGMTRSALRALLGDPDGSKQRARRERYRKPCSECGKLLTGCNGFKGHRTGLCVACELATREREWTAEACIAAAHAWFAHHGRIPIATDWIRAGHEPVRHPGFSTIYSRPHSPFPSWADFIEACGWPRPEVGRHDRSGERGLGATSRLVLASLRDADEPLGPQAIGRPVGLTRLHVSATLAGLMRRGLVTKLAHGKYVLSPTEGSES